MKEGKQGQLASPTLAELYLKQGQPYRAVQVLSEFVAGHPENENARRRLAEMEKELFSAAAEQERKEKIQALKKILAMIGKERA